MTDPGPIEITDENVLKAVEMGLIFGVPDKEHIRKICEAVKKVINDRDNLRTEVRRERKALRRLIRWANVDSEAVKKRVDQLNKKLSEAAEEIGDDDA